MARLGFGGLAAVITFLVSAHLDALEPPKLPDRLSPGQAAQLSEMIEYLHMQMRRVISDVEIDSRKQLVELTGEQWQKVIDVQSRLAEYLRDIGQPFS